MENFHGSISIFIFIFIQELLLLLLPNKYLAMCSLVYKNVIVKYTCYGSYFLYKQAFNCKLLLFLWGKFHIPLKSSTTCSPANSSWPSQRKGHNLNSDGNTLMENLAYKENHARHLEHVFDLLSIYIYVSFFLFPFKKQVAVAKWPITEENQNEVSESFWKGIAERAI